MGGGCKGEGDCFALESRDSVAYDYSRPLCHRTQLTTSQKEFLFSILLFIWKQFKYFLNTNLK